MVPCGFILNIHILIYVTNITKRPITLLLGKWYACSIVKNAYILMCICKTNFLFSERISSYILFNMRYIIIIKLAVDISHTCILYVIKSILVCGNLMYYLLNLLF